ncbi:MAG: zinc ribbon domain-containing protein [Fusobacteriaceae bacterium]|jgi:Protein of unknown function (DUF1407).|nr:zinc ribbon domain-containing protein [Fusobacteriaceae bacterium]MBU9919222.1 zinc ribbon domain-containing protein [Fusobacteriaceae bacterium]
MDMKKSILCPNCGEEIEKDGITGKYSCKSCGKTYGKRAKCDVCDSELELLEACGAQQFFCDTCKELKSRRTVKYFIKELDK